MNEPARVLLIGDDQEHMQTRTNVLRYFWTMATATPEESDQRTPLTDLAVICHTLPEGERQELISRIRQQHPGILLVKVNGYDSGPHAGADATVDAVHGPGALVSTIYELLTERGLPSRGWLDECSLDTSAAPGIH